MVKVITYGTFDLLHAGHIRLLERARALGDWLIVGVTADGYDQVRGKINVQQNLMERLEAVRATGLADEIIVEEYEGQKIDDIRRMGVDIFTVGSDWEGRFDYLSEYCRVVYLPRTEGVSSSELRARQRDVRVGLVGESSILNKFAAESAFVNGVTIAGICTQDESRLSDALRALPCVTSDYEKLLPRVDAVYIASHPSRHEEQCRAALLSGRHVLCESPIAMSVAGCRALYALAREKGLVLADGIKTAYSTAYARLLLMIKSGHIGQVASVDATCTSLREVHLEDEKALSLTWNSLCAWGPAALLPVFQLLGTEYRQQMIVSRIADEKQMFDLFTKIDFVYSGAVASVKVGKGVKSEGELIISGTKGYAYVPAPWWKTDYFELRYENPAENRRYFYQLDGEGIRYEIVAFLKAIETGRESGYVSADVSEAISGVMEAFYGSDGVVRL